MQIMTGDKYGIELEEYKGQYSLAATYTGQDGVTRKEWAKRQTGRDQFAEKATPVKVRLGDRSSAVMALTKILNSLDETPF
jgi:hypothetical protein